MGKLSRLFFFFVSFSHISSIYERLPATCRESQHAAAALARCRQKQTTDCVTVLAVYATRADLSRAQASKVMRHLHDLTRVKGQKGRWTSRVDEHIT